MLPPNFKAGPGRPKKLRRRESDEEGATRLRRSYTTNKCRRCNSKGHNSRRCKLPLPPPETTEEENVVESQSMAAAAPAAQSQVAGGVQEMASDMPTVQPQEVQATQAENIPKHKGRPEKTTKPPGGSQKPSSNKRKITANETNETIDGETQRPSSSKKLKAKLVPRKVASGIQIVEPPTCLQQCHYLNQFLHRWFMSAIYG